MNSILGQKSRWLKRISLSVLGLLLASLPLWGQSLSQSLSPLPSPEEAAQRAESLTPAEWVNIEIDEVTRDRLRFDPRWQPMLRAVQQDIMILKWGNNRLENPVWRQYGAKAFPLLEYYARSAEPTRQTYGMVGIRALGKPYTTLWLEKQLKRRATTPDFYFLTGNPVLLLDPNADAPYEVDWQKEFGLDDRQTRDRLLRIARENLEPATSPGYYNQFNLQFIQSLLGYEASLPPRPALLDPSRDPALGAWNQLAVLRQLSEAQQQEALTIYRGLSPRTQDYLLVKNLGSVEAGKISAAGKALLQGLANDSQSPDRAWAMAELDRHTDSQGSAMLQALLNGNDLSPLYNLTKWASYNEGFYVPENTIDRGTHAYYLLVNIAQKYPQSRFIRAAREYGNLTGRSYFGGELRSPIVRNQIAALTPAQRVERWQNWLDRYPDHPGADDATYFLARSLQDSNQIIPAIDLWVRMMTEAIGDGDAAYLAYPHIRTLLDVGLTRDQVATLATEYRDKAIAPLFQYALAVHDARTQNYAQALQDSEGLDLTKMPESVLGSYYDAGFWYRDDLYDPAQIQREMQAFLTEQRQRWQQLQQLKAQDTTESNYAIASHWAGEGGWKNGYLPLWDGFRVSLIPTGDWGDDFCQIYWVCDDRRRSLDAIRESYQQSSQNAIALRLYTDLLDRDDLPASLREKSLFMAASTVLWQWEDHPIGETIRIHPLAGVNAYGTILNSVTNPDDLYQEWQRSLNQVQQDYQRYLDQTIAQLKQTFPRSAYIDDLLFSRYAMSGELRFLQEIVQQHSQGDRANEARFLLANRSVPAAQADTDPLVADECQDLQTAIAQTLGVEVTLRSDITFRDYVTQQNQIGCQLTAMGTGETFPSFVEVAQKLQTLLVYKRWAVAPEYTADGPTGMAIGFTKSGQVALLNVEWNPAPGVNCLDDQPISACAIAPSEQQYTITLNVGVRH